MHYSAIVHTASLKPLVKKTLWDKNFTKKKEYSHYTQFALLDENNTFK